MDNRKTIKNYFDETPFTKKHLHVIILLAIAMIFEQADNYNFSFVAPVLRQEWGISIQQVGYVNSCFAIGMLIGTFGFSIVSDKIGRKHSIVLCAVVFSLGSLFNGLAPNIELFILFRCLTGIGISGLLIVAPPYLMEMLPSKNRGRIYGIAMIAPFIGIPIVSLVCNIIIPMGGEWWRLIYIMGALGLIIAVLGHFWLVESPRWLVSKGRIQEAEKNVEKIVGADKYKADLSGQMHTKSAEKIPLSAIFKEIFNKKNWKLTIGLMLSYCFTISFGLIFINFAGTLMLDSGFEQSQALQLASMLSLGIIGGPVITALFSEMGGRKIPLVFTGIITGCAIFVFATTDNYTVMCIAGMVETAVGQANIVMLNAYTPEMYPTKIRNAALGVITSVGRIFNIIMMAIFPMIYAALGFGLSYGILGIGFLIIALCVGLFGVRTSGRSLEEISE